MANSVVLVAGNIGAGKTEICRIIAKNKNVFLPLMNDWGTSKEVITVPEFIDPEALELFYSDRKRYTGIFEDSCLIHRIVRHLEARDKGGLFIFDRGMIEGAETFCKNSFEEGYLSHSRYERYLGGLKDALDDLGRDEADRWLESLIVYLQVRDINILQERLRRRDTKCEIVDLNYHRKINERYEEFMTKIGEEYRRYGVRAPELLVIDASVDMNSNQDYHKNVLEQIVRKLIDMKNEQRC